jgi:hypothetical protein
MTDDAVETDDPIMMQRSKSLRSTPTVLMVMCGVLFLIRTVSAAQVTEVNRVIKANVKRGSCDARAQPLPDCFDERS